jgi:hypothetical protein
LDFLPESIPPEHWAKLLDEMPGLAIPSSPLIRVVAIGQSVETQGVTVDLIAMEVRQAGAVLYWRALASRDVPMLMADVSLSDDQGTSYRVMPAGSGSGGHEWQGQTYVVPAPPTNANLAIVLDSFGPHGQMPMPGYIAMDPVRGPWRFEVPASVE